MDRVGHALKVDRSGRYLPLGGLEAMRQMAAGGKIESHDSIVGVEQGRVDCEIGR